MPDPDLAGRTLLLLIASTVIQARRARGWTQRRLAREAGVSQGLVSLIERALVPDLPIATAVRVLAPLEVPFDLRLAAPITLKAPKDAAHARCCAFVAGRVERHGFIVLMEAEVNGPGWVGSIDILAYHPIAHVVLVLEVKTELEDLGAIDRQLRRYERAAWDAALQLGWRPRAVVGGLLLLGTDDNDRRLAAERAWFDRTFGVRARAFFAFLQDPERPPERGMRCLAMIDPRSRRARWVSPTWIDGRRSPAPYRTRPAYLAGLRNPSERRRRRHQHGSSPDA